jgi:PAS domain S-box-containing protein
VTAAGTLGMTKKLDTVFGEREIKLTARLMPVEKGAEAVILLICEDVTDRRALERQLGVSTPSLPAAVPSEPGLSPADAQTFGVLGKSLRTEKMQPGAPALVKIHAVPLHKPGLPPIVTGKIDSFPHPVMIVQNQKIQYANPATLKLLRFETLESLQEKMIFADGPPRGVSTAKLATGDGGVLSVNLTAQPIAWRNGPALQVTLTETQATSATPAEPKADIIEFQDTPASRPKAEKAGETSKPGRGKSEDIVELPREEARPGPQRPEPASLPAKTEASAAKVTREPGRYSDIAAAEELHKILDTAADGIVTLDRAGNIRTFSAGAEAIFGYRIAEVVEKPLASLLTPDSRRVLRDYLSALQGPGLATVFNDGREVTAVVKQGGVVPLFLTIGRLHSTAQNGAAFCAVLRDITQWKRTEAELRKAKDVAEQASRQKSEFLAKISHELRTPLNAILGFSEVMRMERFGEIRNEKYRGYVNDIHASGAHLLSLINDLLDLSKVEAGKLELNFTSVALAEVIEHTVKMVQEQATSARVILRRTMPADLPNVVADYRSMSQIMLNLLTNAIKFTDPGGQIIISAQLTNAGELKLRVKDTGLGMTEAEIKEALEPFRRITTDGRDVPGTGLGLPLTKALAEANRTKFEISSEPRKGTVIEITFPTTRVLAV